MATATILPRDVHQPQAERAQRPNASSFIRHALRAGFTIEEIFNLTKIDRWFSGADQRDRGLRGGIGGGEELKL